MMMNCSKEKCMNWALFLLRLVLGIVFVYHGYGKLFGMAPGMEGFTMMIGKIGFPMAGVFAYIVAIGEFVGGLAMLAGVYTKYAGYFLAFIMAVVVVIVKKFAYPMVELDLALLVMSLAIAWMGPGSMVVMKNAPGDCSNCCGNKDGCKMCAPGSKK
jgi:putative oxidoreductase